MITLEERLEREQSIPSTDLIVIQLVLFDQRFHNHDDQFFLQNKSIFIVVVFKQRESSECSLLARRFLYLVEIVSTFVRHLIALVHNDDVVRFDRNLREGERRRREIDDDRVVPAA